ncbi:MAG: metallophosphoesterase [Thermotogota bacterium]|nr:metallophosphoesterase [Thermotogota bacterium]
MRMPVKICLFCLIMLIFSSVVWALPDYYTLWVPVDSGAESRSPYWPAASSDRYEPYTDLTWDHPLRVAFSSDPHFGRPESNTEATKAIIRSVNEAVPAFHAFFVLGDITEYGFVEAQWQISREVFSLSTKVPIIPLMGNHDDLMNGRSKFLQYLIPNATMEKSRKVLWQRIDLGPVHFIKLNLMWGAEDWGPDVEAWLEAELASIPRDEWVIILSHCFFYSSGSYKYGVPWFDHPETTALIAPILEKYAADLSFAGHNHHMELTTHNGVFYIVTGTFGGVLSEAPFEHHSPTSLWYQKGTHGYTDVTVYPDQAIVVFRDTEGRAIKRFILPQNQAR